MLCNRNLKLKLADYQHHVESFKNKSREMDRFSQLEMIEPYPQASSRVS